jgi:hypothetical protein
VASVLVQIQGRCKAAPSLEQVLSAEGPVTTWFYKCGKGVPMGGPRWGVVTKPARLRGPL